MDWFNKIHVVLLAESDNFEPKEPTNNAATMDKWEGEDEEEDVKVYFFFTRWIFTRDRLSDAALLKCRGGGQSQGGHSPVILWS